MTQLNNIKIVLSGASGKPYKFEAKIKGKPKATTLLQKVKRTITRGAKSAVYFSFTISDYTETMIKYDIVSYGYVDDIDTFLKKFRPDANEPKPVYIAYHKADKNACPSIICDIINAPGFSAVDVHSSEIRPDDTL